MPGSDARRYRLSVRLSDLTAGVVQEHVVEGGLVDVPVLNVHVHQPTLDDVFLHYTGREIRESHAEAMPARVRAWHGRRR